jgi:hypothetical protein
MDMQGGHECRQGPDLKALTVKLRKRGKTMAYSKPQYVAQNSAQGTFAAGSATSRAGSACTEMEHDEGFGQIT